MDASKNNPCAMPGGWRGRWIRLHNFRLELPGGTFGAEMNLRTFDEIARERQEESARIKRCRCEMIAIEAKPLAANPDVGGLCVALSDWSTELRLINAEKRPQEKPAAAGAGRARKEGIEATG